MEVLCKKAKLLIPFLKEQLIINSKLSDVDPVLKGKENTKFYLLSLHHLLL